ncbi:MAG: hypothetical protein WCP97_08940 [bacterium]
MIGLVIAYIIVLAVLLFFLSKARKLAIFSSPSGKQFFPVVVLFITITTVSILSLLLLTNTVAINDEIWYMRVISDVQRFDFFSYTITQIVTSLPGYLYTIGLISMALGITSLNGLRVLSFVMVVGNIPLFYLLVRQEEQQAGLLKTLQFYFLPILFPFFFLIYTDVFSVMFILGMFYQIMKKRYNTAGVVGLLGMMIRQHTIVWYGLAFVLAYLREEGWKWSWIEFRQMKRFASFIVGFAAFIAFVVVNKGVSVGDRYMHPTFSFHIENIYFALFLLFFLSLPSQIMHWKQHLQLMEKRLTWFGITVVVAGYILFFRVTHPYNIVSGVWRNHLFWLIQQHVYLHILFLLAVIFAFLFLLNTKLKNPTTGFSILLL